MKQPYEHEPEYVLPMLRLKLKDYLVNSKLESLVIGVSGGIDSAIVAAVAKPVCDELHMNLIGFSLPSASNKPDEIERAAKVGKSFCHVFNTIIIDNFVEIFINNLLIGIMNQEKKDKIRKGNVKARVRMIILYDQAQLYNGCVLGTDNFTELMVGFWTLHGDVGDIGMIQNLWKTDVYNLSRYIVEKGLTGNAKEALQLCIDAVPTDGLGITNSDLDQLAAPTYEEVDNILKKWIYKKEGDPNHPVIKRHLNTEFKRNNPYNFEI